MNRKIWCAGLLTLVMIIGTGCGEKALSGTDSTQQQNAAGQNQVDDKDPVTVKPNTDKETVAKPDSGTQTKPESEKTPPKDPDKSSSMKKEKIDVYYTDPQEMELKKSQKEISFQDELGKYKEAYKSLQSSNSADLVSLWAKVELKSLVYKDGAMTMDVHLPDEARLGAGGEQYALDALKNTMFQFNEVKSVELLVDGAKVESLMGHVDLDHPMTKN
ncbi:GerMN domain-containing protein [Paenibacillus pini]|uniref:OrfW protein n=1 Tax=Paenibacillus pini JCM 16418 TaxID=1236976 RepID=W7YDZ4_9BACL|nr:GerMN domain-containing protein [Paenibacillus pini]GAF09135.1 OrfW protein [Paenibacillus pini JCM 16418]